MTRLSLALLACCGSSAAPIAAQRATRTVSWNANVPVSAIALDGESYYLYALPGWISPTPGLLQEPIHPLA